MCFGLLTVVMHSLLLLFTFSKFHRKCGWWTSVSRTKTDYSKKAKRKEKKGQRCDWLINTALYFFWLIRSRTKVWFWKHDFSRLLWPLHNWLIGLARPILIGQRDYSGFARLWHSNKKHLFIKCYPTNYFNREVKSLHHVAIVANFSDDNKPKASLKKWIRTVSNFIDLIQFHFY